MADYTLLITNYGQAKIADAIANSTQINLTQLAFGDSNGSYYEPSTAQTALVNEVKRIDINNKTVDVANPNKVIIEGFIPADDYGYQIREMAIFDSTGGMLAVRKYPLIDKINPSTGALIDLYIKEYLVVSNAATVFDLTIDPSVIVATNQSVDTKVSDHNTDPDAHYDVTQAHRGFMTAADKIKLDGLQNYVHPATHSIAEVSELQTALDNKADINHNHLYYLGTPYSVNSGNQDSNGLADLIYKIDDSSVGFKIGGAYPNAIITFPSGGRYEISSISDINNINADGAYTFVIEKDNLNSNGDGTYSALATHVKVGYTSVEPIPPLTTESHTGYICHYTGSTSINPYLLFDQNSSTRTNWYYVHSYPPVIHNENPSISGAGGGIWAIEKDDQSDMYINSVKVTQNYVNIDGFSKTASYSIKLSNDHGATFFRTISVSGGLSNTTDINDTCNYLAVFMGVCSGQPDAHTAYSGINFKDINIIQTVSYPGGSITEQLIDIDSSSGTNGDYNLNYGVRPFNATKKINGIWAKKQFVKLAKGQRSSSILATPKTLWFNDTAFLKVSTTSGSPVSVENLFQTDQVSVQIKEDGIIKNNINPTVTKDSIDWTAGFTGNTDVIIKRAY